MGCCLGGRESGKPEKHSRILRMDVGDVVDQSAPQLMTPVRKLVDCVSHESIFVNEQTLSWNEWTSDGG